MTIVLQFPEQTVFDQILSSEKRGLFSHVGSNLLCSVHMSFYRKKSMCEVLPISCFRILFHCEVSDSRIACENCSDSESMCDGDECLFHLADDGLHEFEEEHNNSDGSRTTY